MINQKIIRYSTACGLLILILTGCDMIGHRIVRQQRTDYNIAIQQTNNEQMLLNLVRLRYRDVPYFMELVSVSTSFDLRTAVSASASFPASADNLYGTGAGLSYSEKPTLTYTPLQGDQFVNQLMSPIELRIIALLYHSGWSIDRIFRVTIQRMDKLFNAPSASGPTPKRIPKYQEFAEVTSLLRELQKRGQLDLVYTGSTESEQEKIYLQVTEDARSSTEVKKIEELLNVTLAEGQLLLNVEAAKYKKNHITIVPRSLLSVLFYLSQSVSVPEKDQQLGLVTMTADPQGNIFDWNNLTKGLMGIQHWPDDKPPQTAFISVKYRNNWFYIDDSDLDSKSTFSLLMQLFALQAGEIKSTGPILTLPVN